MIKNKFKKIIYFFCATIVAASIWYGATHWYGITPYRPADQAALSEIVNTDWYLLVSEDSTDFSLEYLFKHMAAVPSCPDNSLNIFVYRVHGKPVGFVTYYRESSTRGRIQFLAVSREHRRYGYARKLLAYAINDAAAHGMFTVELATRINNHTAQKLYRQFNFRKTWEESGFVGFEKSLLV